MRNIVLSVAVLLAGCSIAPVQTTAPLPQRRDDLLTELSSRLKISADDSVKVYERMFQSIVESGDEWFATFVDNESFGKGAGPTITESNQRVLAVSIVTPGRFSNFTLVTLTNHGALFYFGTETLPRERANMLSELADVRSNPAHEILAETGAFASTVERGYVSLTNYLTERNASGKQYIDAGVIALSGE